MIRNVSINNDIPATERNEFDLKMPKKKSSSHETKFSYNTT